jgi:hypothetical protein
MLEVMYIYLKSDTCAQEKTIYLELNNMLRVFKIFSESDNYIHS